MNSSVQSEQKDISVIQTTPQDLKFVLELQTDLKLSFWSLEDYINELQRTDSVNLIVKERKTQKGFLVARLIISDTTAEIYNIGVSREARRKGYATLLITELINICRSKNIKSVWLDVRKSNQSAIEFYKSRGFIVTGQRKNFYMHPAEDAYLLQLILS